ncbi:hypothetical protein ACPV36_12395 [Photobacterium damselae]|uniref:hypothetical protein n=1 Tax=Photobacterium damselae TaxID=38293 RepID=UPI00406834C2
MKLIYSLILPLLFSGPWVMAATVKVLNIPTAQQSYTLNGNDQHQLKIEPIKTDIILHPDIPPVLVKEIAAKLAQQQIQYQWQYTELNGVHNQESITFSLTPNTQKPLIFTGTHGELDVSSPLTVVKDLDDALLSKPDMAGFMKQYCTEAFLPIGTLHQYLELNDSKQVDVEKHIVLRCQRVVPTVEISVLSTTKMAISGQDTGLQSRTVDMGFLIRNSSLSRNEFTVTAAFGPGFTCDSRRCFLNRLDFDVAPKNRIMVELKTESGKTLQNGKKTAMNFDLVQDTLIKKTWSLNFLIRGDSVAPGTYKGTINLSVNLI